MKIRKILATLAAAAVACSAMAVSAFAATVEGPSKDFTVDVNVDAEGGVLVVAPEDLPEGWTEATVEITIPEGAWGGGCVGYNNPEGTWTSVNWSNEDAASLTQVLTPDMIAAGEGFQIQVWWLGGADALPAAVTFTVPDAEDEPTDEPTEDEPVEDEPAEDEPVEDEPTEEEPSDDNVQTGATAGLALAAIALAGAAVVATKKNK